MSRRDIHKEIISDLLVEAGLDETCKRIDLDHLTDCLIGHFESIGEADMNAHLGGLEMAQITQAQLDEMKEWQRKACVHLVNIFTTGGQELNNDEAYFWVKHSKV